MGRLAVSKGKVQDGILIQGFMRLQIMDYDENGQPTIVARDKKGRLCDSGRLGPNQITNVGFQNYINYLFGTDANSKKVSYAAVGTGTDPASNASSLTGEHGTRKTVTWSAPASKTVRWTAAFASSDNTTGNIAVQCAGLYNHSSELSLMCGKSFTSSTWGTNQALNLTYEIVLS